MNTSGIPPHDTPLSEIIFQRLEKSPARFLRFDELMDLALYHHQHGYYASSLGRKIGRRGDFYTSVSVGDTFGLLLSHAIEQKWLKIRPNPDYPLTIIEQGAHDGQLARDILAGFEKRKSPLLKNLAYIIVEPRETIREELEGEVFPNQWHTAPSLEEARREAGIFLCNELPDAFPVRRFVWECGAWRDQGVTMQGENLILTTAEIDAGNDEDFQRFLNLLPENPPGFENGYTTEFCPSLKTWTHDLSQLFEKNGAWFIIDYGFSAGEYFKPSRKTGTLKCFHQHRTHENPLWRIGENDITAHVNFTDLINLATDSGMRLDRLRDQGAFLIEAGRDWLLGMEGTVPGKEDAAKLRQFQTLTHPSLMGRSFKVAEFSR